tara:strand:+ start:108 stop:431 length:324 start_codon:yes stop_codon:yes gene_type:complete
VEKREVALRYCTRNLAAFGAEAAARALRCALRREIPPRNILETNRHLPLNAFKEIGGLDKSCREPESKQRQGRESGASEAEGGEREPLANCDGTNFPFNFFVFEELQ